MHIDMFQHIHIYIPCTSKVVLVDTYRTVVNTVVKTVVKTHIVHACFIITHRCTLLVQARAHYCSYMLYYHTYVYLVQAGVGCAFKKTVVKTVVKRSCIPCLHKQESACRHTYFKRFLYMYIHLVQTRGCLQTYIFFTHALLSHTCIPCRHTYFSYMLHYHTYVYLVQAGVGCLRERPATHCQPLHYPVP